MLKKNKKKILSKCRTSILQALATNRSTLNLWSLHTLQKYFPKSASYTPARNIPFHNNLRHLFHAGYQRPPPPTPTTCTCPQEQVTKLISEVLFHAWRQYATKNPLVRLERKNRPASRSAWVQRMMAPKSKAARGTEDEGGDGSRGGAAGPLQPTLEKEVKLCRLQTAAV